MKQERHEHFSWRCSATSSVGSPTRCGTSGLRAQTADETNANEHLESPKVSPTPHMDSQA